MRCDFHVFIEKWDGPNKMQPEGTWRVWGDVGLRLDGSDDLFAALSGMRKRKGFKELIPARGFPEEVSGTTFAAMHVQVVEDADHDPKGSLNHSRPYFLRSSVKRGWKLVKRYGQDHVWWPGSSHGHSYLTLEEIHRCLEHAGLELGKTDLLFQTVVATMEKLSERYETRMVFWYDA